MVMNAVNWLRVFCVSLIMSLGAQAWAVTYDQQPLSNRAFAEEKPVQGIQVKLRPRQVMMGQPIQLIIEGQNLHQVLKGVDIPSYRKDFAVDDLEQDENRFRLTFYPLKPGEFVLQKQQSGELTLPQAAIKVLPNPEAQVVWQAPALEVLSKQMVKWQAQIEVADPAYQVSLHAPHKLDDAIELFLPKTEASLSSKRQLTASFQMPEINQKASFKLRSPVVHIKNRGNRVWKFFDAQQIMTLKPLPSFLPMGASVGKIDWHAESLPWFVESQKLYYWTWKFQAADMSEQALKATVYRLLQQLQAKDVAWLSESFSAQQTVTDQGMQVEMQVQIPFRVETSGRHVLQTLSLRYFNADSAKVEQHNLAEQSFLALPSWLIWLAQWLLLLLALLGFFMLVFVAKQVWLNRRFKQALKQTDRAQSSTLQAQQIWQQLQSWQASQQALMDKSFELDQQHSPVTVLWLQWYQRLVQPSAAENEALQNLLRLINEQLFADKEITQETLRKALHNWLKHLPLLPRKNLISRYFRAYAQWLNWRR